MANFRYSHLYNSGSTASPSADALNVAEIALTTLKGSEALWFKNSAEEVIKVGVGVSYTKDESDLKYVTGGTYVSTDKKIKLNNGSGTTVAEIDATPFLGMLNNVALDGGTLKFTWNTEANKTAVNIDLSDYFATKTELGEVHDLLSGISESLEELEARDFVEYTTFDNDRKTIQLRNHDSISGLMTNNPATDGFKPDKAGGVNLVMVSKWNVADFGSTQLPINLNGAKAHPTYNDKNEIALLSDVEAAKGDLTTHTSNNEIHVTKEDKANWNGKADKTYVDTELGKKADESYVDETFFASLVYDSTAKTITFYAKDGETELGEIDTTDFVKDGMVDKVEVKDGKLVITFNTDSGKEEIDIDITKIFDASNYYTAEEVDAELAKKADKSNTYTKGEVNTELGKKADKSDTYIKTEVDEKLAEKLDTTAFTQYQGEVTAALASKLDKSDFNDYVEETEETLSGINTKVTTLENNVITGGTTTYDQTSNELTLTLNKQSGTTLKVDVEMSVINQGGILIKKGWTNDIILSAGTF